MTGVSRLSGSGLKQMRPSTKALIITGFDDILTSIQLGIEHLEEAELIKTQIVSFEVSQEIKALLAAHAAGEDPWKR
jgi:hypothetical protein